MTTAERRHPEFRTRGVGKCEWDGAVWPFATSQVLTAMANFKNNYVQKTASDSLYFDIFISWLNPAIQVTDHILANISTK